jgi:hypothetical protein
LLTPSLGDGLMLESIAVTIRGVSLQGGVGGIIPTISRSIFVTMLCNAIHLQNSSASLLPIMKVIGSDGGASDPQKVSLHTRRDFRQRDDLVWKAAKLFHSNRENNGQSKGWLNEANAGLTNEKPQPSLTRAFQICGDTGSTTRRHCEARLLAGGQPSHTGWSIA